MNKTIRNASGEGIIIEGSGNEFVLRIHPKEYYQYYIDLSRNDLAMLINIADEVLLG